MRENPLGAKSDHKREREGLKMLIGITSFNFGMDTRQEIMTSVLQPAVLHAISIAISAISHDPPAIQELGSVPGRA